MERILITGASGAIGGFLRTRLARPDRVLRLLDVVPPAGGDQVEPVTGSVTDPDAVAAACADVSAVVHLGGHSREQAWDDILTTNIDGTHTVLAAAQAAGVGRVVLASSNHAAGFRTVGEDGPDGLRADSSPRPDTYYGVSKAAMEALGALYHHRFGMDVLCLRIGTCAPRPPDERALSTWLSPDDAGRLVEACLTAPSPGYRIVWGISANTRRVCSLREAAELGYLPRDDAERFAPDLAGGRAGPPTGPVPLGGPFTTTPLGLPN
ncbi:MAG TPA: NAD(P)-dependent oxidoreductase [Pseudonocardiaceae bacterium]